MHIYPDIGRIPRPDDFKYASVMEKGRPIHDGDYFSLRHPHMHCGKRAKIFAPFAALQGFEEEVASKDIIYEEKRIIDPERSDDLNETLCLLHELTKTKRLALLNQAYVSAEYYILCTDPHNEAYKIKGLYITAKGVVQYVDPIGHLIRIEDECISFSDLYSLTLLHRQTV